MPLVLAEGQAGATSQMDISYPEINTCMSLTIVYKDPEYLVGGHFSCPVGGMHCITPAMLIPRIREKIGLIGTVHKIFFIGARGNWTPTQTQPIYDFIGELDEMFASVVEYDTSDWGTVDVNFKADGSIAITPRGQLSRFGRDHLRRPMRWR